jgi:hypothetical protein
MTKDYTERRLERMTKDALLEAQKAVNNVQSEAATRGAIGNSRVYLLYDEAVGNILEAALSRMAEAAFRASGGTSDWHISSKGLASSSSMTSPTGCKSDTRTTLPLGIPDRR